MTDILIFTHVDYCPPAHLGTFLDACGEDWREVRCDLGQLAEVDLDQPKAVAVMGGGMSVNDPLPWLNEEIAALRHLIKRDIPLIGHCLGGQLLARALGAEVRRLPYTEAGWQPMRKLTDSPWLAHVDDEFPIYQWHSDSFAIPDGATRLLASPWCDNQAFSWGDKVLGLQGHPEMTAELILHWLDTAGHLLDDGQDSQQERALSISELPRKIAALNRVAEGFYRHWLGLANG